MVTKKAASKGKGKITAQRGSKVATLSNTFTDANGKQHDLHEGGKWIPSVVGLVYANVEAGDAVEMTTKEGKVRTVVVAYVVSNGFSQKEQKPYTRFLPVPEPREEKTKGTRRNEAASRVSQLEASVNAKFDALFAELRNIRR